MTLRLSNRQYRLLKDFVDNNGVMDRDWAGRINQGTMRSLKVRGFINQPTLNQIQLTQAGKRILIDWDSVDIYRKIASTKLSSIFR